MVKPLSAIIDTPVFPLNNSMNPETRVSSTSEMDPT